MPPVKRPHAETAYANAAMDLDGVAMLAGLVEKHGLRGVLSTLAEMYMARATGAGLRSANQGTAVRAARTLEACEAALGRDEQGEANEGAGLRRTANRLLACEDSLPLKVR